MTDFIHPRFLWKASILGVIVVLSGCSGTIGSSGHIQEACYWLSDAEIEAATSVFNVDRNQGFSYQQELATVSQTCSQSGDARGCITCFTLILNDVYGN
ncbi:MAG: hypothetical protein HJJLKODD_03008 [Phycisphaerae bacterium]|nr:hypothetical protein [Phycisphaerae bacterium]